MREIAKNGQIDLVKRPFLDVTALPVGASMPYQVVGIHSKTMRDQVLGEMGVTSAMLTKPMRHNYYPFGLFGSPGTVKQFFAVYAMGKAFVGVHGQT